MYARLSCSAELLRPSRMVRSSYRHCSESALPPDVRRGFAPPFTTLKNFRGAAARNVLRALLRRGKAHASHQAAEPLLSRT